MAANRVQELREAHGLTREELAQRAKVTYAYIYKLEVRGAENPSGESIMQVAAALGVTVEQLLGRAPLPGPLADLQAEGLPDARLYEMQALWNDLSDDEREVLVNTARSVWRLRHPSRKPEPNQAPGDA
jgi:transcriptional regulator with XRE-family HTH domain